MVRLALARKYGATEQLQLPTGWQPMYSRLHKFPSRELDLGADLGLRGGQELEWQEELQVYSLPLPHVCQVGRGVRSADPAARASERAPGGEGGHPAAPASPRHH